MTFKMSDQLKKEVLKSIGAVARNGDLNEAFMPYDTLSVRMKEGFLHIGFEKDSELVCSIILPNEWDKAVVTRISGVSGNVLLTSSEN